MAVALSSSDPSSYSESDRCEVTFLDWDVAINFKSHTISGFAHLTVRKKCENLDTLVSLRLFFSLIVLIKGV